MGGLLKAARVLGTIKYLIVLSLKVIIFLNMSTSIHPTAVVDKNAILQEGVSVGPYAVIEQDVEIDNDVLIGPYAHIKGKTRIGAETTIGTGAVIGETPQMAGMLKTQGGLTIGKNNIIREYVTIHAATKDGASTVIGHNNFFMGLSHVAHDCVLSDNIILCNGSLLAGHVQVDKGAFISGNVVVHQFVRIGRLAMIGGLSRVNQDVAPFMMIVGDSRVWGINLVGLKRAGFSKEQISKIQKAYKALYHKGRTVKNSLPELQQMDCTPVKEIMEFILLSKRGVCGPKRSTLMERLFLDYPYMIRSRISERHYLLNRF